MPFKDEQVKSDLFTLETHWVLDLGDTGSSVWLCVFHNGASQLCAFPVYMPGIRSREP